MVSISWRTFGISVVVNLAWGLAMRFLPGHWWLLALGAAGVAWGGNAVLIARSMRALGARRIPPPAPAAQTVDPLAPGFVPPTLSLPARARLCKARASGKAAQDALAETGCPLFMDTPDFTEGRADGAADWDRDLVADTETRPAVPAAPRSLTYLVAWFMGYVARGVSHGAKPTAAARPN